MSENDYKLSSEALISEISAEVQRTCSHLQKVDKLEAALVRLYTNMLAGPNISMTHLEGLQQITDNFLELESIKQYLAEKDLTNLLIFLEDLEKRLSNLLMHAIFSKDDSESTNIQ